MYLFAKCRSVFSIELGFRLSSSLRCIAKREEKERRGDTLEMGTICRVGGGKGKKRRGKERCVGGKGASGGKRGLTPPVKKGAASGMGFQG